MAFALVLRWLAMLTWFVSAVYFCLGMAFAWPILPFFIGFGAGLFFLLVAMAFTSRQS
jgi:hypothetical protein